MGRKRMYKDIELPREMAKCIKSLIAEEERERHAGYISEYIERVAIAMGVAEQDLERKVAIILVDDIAKGIGYDKSKLSLYMDLNTYYRRRRRYIYDVAIALGLK